MRHSLETSVLQEVLNYLGAKPYTEVSALIIKIQSDAKAIQEPVVVAEPVQGE